VHARLGKVEVSEKSLSLVSKIFMFRQSGLTLLLPLLRLLAAPQKRPSGCLYPFFLASEQTRFLANTQGMTYTLFFSFKGREILFYRSLILQSGRLLPRLFEL